MTSGLRQHLRGRHGFSNYLLSWYVRWIAIMISSSDWIRSTSQTRSKRGEREKACVWERSVERWNKNTSLFLFIDVINVCPHYLHACRMESSVWGTWKQEALIIVFTSADKNPCAVMISNYKYFPGFYRPQPHPLWGSESRLHGLIMTLHKTKCSSLCAAG